MTFEHRHENKSCSACLSDQRKHLTYDSMTGLHFNISTTFPGSQLLFNIWTFFNFHSLGTICVCSIYLPRCSCWANKTTKRFLYRCFKVDKALSKLVCLPTIRWTNQIAWILSRKLKSSKQIAQNFGRKFKWTNQVITSIATIYSTISYGISCGCKLLFFQWPKATNGGLEVE